MTWISSTDDGCVITVKATPRASKTELRGIENDCLRVRLQAPPVEGKANDALREFFAAAFKIPRRDVVLVAGETSRHKRLLLRGVPAALATAQIMGSVANKN